MDAERSSRPIPALLIGSALFLCLFQRSRSFSVANVCAAPIYFNKIPLFQKSNQNFPKFSFLKSQNSKFALIKNPKLLFSFPYHDTFQTKCILQLLAIGQRTQLIKYILNNDLELFECDFTVFIPEELFPPLLLVELQVLWA